MQMQFNIKKVKRQIFSRVRLVRGLFLCLFLCVIFLFFFLTYRILANSVVGTYAGLARDFILPSSNRIITNNGNINVLIMGKGGTGHDAPDLTDTMILASISTLKNKMVLVSIPRDIWVSDLKDKVNSAYMYGKAKQPSGGGLLLAKSTIEKITGVQVDYSVVLDFNGFKDVIDTLHGIEVEVKTGFTDSQYPIAGRENDNCNGDKTFACRYETITFNPGLQTMDGDTALKFVRSRHAVGPEGNDISREARQQLVVNGIVKKMTVPSIFTNFSIDKKLLQILESNLETDFQPAEEATLARYMLDARSDIKSYTIPDNLLYNPPNEYKYFNSLYTHAFVFIPNNKISTAINSKTEDWSDIQAWIQTVLP